MQSLDRIVIHSAPVPMAFVGQAEVVKPAIRFEGLDVEAFVDGAFQAIQYGDILNLGIDGTPAPCTIFVKPGVVYQPSQIELRCGYVNESYEGSPQYFGTAEPEDRVNDSWRLEGDFSCTLFFREGKSSMASGSSTYYYSDDDGTFRQQITNASLSGVVGVYGITYVGSNGFWKLQDEETFKPAPLASNGNRLVRVLRSELRPRPPVYTPHPRASTPPRQSPQPSSTSTTSHPPSTRLPGGRTASAIGGGGSLGAGSAPAWQCGTIDTWPSTSSPSRYIKACWRV